jgi:hypothetical protein
MSDEHEMALRFFGYGDWGAKYWFIGPEQGKGKNEQPGNDHRVAAWVKLGRPEICDIQKFHAEIGQAYYFSEKPSKVPLQPTWRLLILVLLATFGIPNPTDPEVRREYQREEWGRVSRKTCLIELSGLSAKGFHEEMDRQKFLPQRIDTIIKKISKHSPKLVVMYGAGEREMTSWEKIVGASLERERPVRRDDTVFMVMPHTNTRRRTNLDWEKLGSKLHDFGLGS